jgi:hypothetical protein
MIRACAENWVVKGFLFDKGAGLYENASVTSADYPQLGSSNFSLAFVCFQVVKRGGQSKGEKP